MTRKLHFTKKLILAVTLLSVALGTSAAFADKPSLGVAEFRNNAAGVYWWGSAVGWDLSGMLTNELAATGAFSMVERSKLEPVLREQDLADYGRVSGDKAAKMGKMTGAEYIVLATVSAFDANTKGTGGGIGYKGIRVGGKKKQAYIAVDLRVVNSTTSEIEYVRTVEARTGGRGISLGLSKWGLGGNLEHEEDTPVGKAIRAVVVEISDYLECAMVKQGSCMDAFDAKEAKRRDGLKDTIKLD